MSKRKSSQQPIDTIIKIRTNLRSEIIDQLEAFEPSKTKNLLEELKELLKFNGKRKKYSDFYLEISIYQIEKIADLLFKFNDYYKFKNPSDNLKSKLNKNKEEIFDELMSLTSKFYVESNIDEDTNLNYDYCDNDIINDEPINKSIDEPIKESNNNESDNKSNNNESNNESDNKSNNNESIDEPIKESNNNESNNETDNKSNNNKSIDETDNESNIDEDTNLNHDYCDNDIIYDEQINESNYNNESIDPTINKSTINEKTINKSTNNDKIIEDLFTLVFKYLSIDDLFNCRLVNKQFKKLSDNTNGINKLIIGEPGLFGDYYWYYNNKTIEDKDLINLKCFKTIQSLSIFNLDKNLKYLKIYDKQFQLTEISNLINLESLEFSHFYYRDNYHQQIMDLNNLKFLALNNILVKLNTPKLEKIQFNNINAINLVSNLQSIKHLIIEKYNFNELKMFKNLEIIELRHFECKTINENLLIVFKNLKQLKINLNFNKIKYSDKIIEKSLIKILTDKIKLKKEIDIYLEGIKIESINNFNKLININQYSYWRFLLANYNLLDSNISFIGTLSYSDLEKCFNKSIKCLPDSFFDKFNCIHRIEIFYIKDVNGLKWFLNNLKCLLYLEIDSRVPLGQNFYDYNLPSTIRFLNIYTKEDVNYKFILKLSKLIQLYTVIDKDLFDLVFTSFLNLKYLKYFRFVFKGTKITIFKNGDNYNYFYSNQIREKLDYNQLREECNKIRVK